VKELSQVEMRPLSIGELLDRAVTICVRKFPMLSLIYLLFIVPVTLCQIWGRGDQGSFFNVLPDLLRAGQGDTSVDPKEISKIFDQLTVFNAYSGLWVVLMVFIRELPIAALMIAISQAYLGSAVSLGNAYGQALRRWLPLVGLTLLYVMLSVLFCVSAVAIFLSLLLGAVLLGMLVPQFILAIEIPVGVLFTIAFSVLALLIGVSLYMSYLACIIERESIMGSFRLAMQRSLAPRNLRRSLAVAFTLGAIAGGFILVGVAVSAVLDSIFKGDLAGLLFTSLLSVVFIVFVTGLFVTYYYDVRIRREGFDLEYEMSKLEPVAQPGNDSD
jgi:hypothetical protein